MTVLLWALAAAMVVLGVVGTVLPALPGPILVLAGLVLAAWADGFARVGPATLVLLAGLTLLAHVVDLAAAALGARRVGASRRAVVGAGLGALAGLFFGLPGLIVGPFLGAAGAELTAHRDLSRAGQVGLAAWLGFVVGSALKLGVVFTMIATFVAAFYL